MTMQVRYTRATSATTVVILENIEVSIYKFKDVWKMTNNSKAYKRQIIIFLLHCSSTTIIFLFTTHQFVHVFIEILFSTYLKNKQSIHCFDPCEYSLQDYTFIFGLSKNNGVLSITLAKVGLPIACRPCTKWHPLCFYL